MAQIRRPVGWILLLVLFLLSGSAHLDAGEQVAFNVESKKYHCVTCQWAKKCTQNCILISKEEAKRRGGVPCKVCGGC